MIPISRPLVDSRAERLVLEVLRSGHLAQGRFVEELESRMTELVGSAHAIAVSSGTSALEMAVERAITPGDVVITTPFTFAATLNSILRAGGRARFVDIDEDFNLDIDALEAAIDPETTALIPVHLYGRPCDLDTLEQISARYGLRVIEDAAQAIGALSGDRPVGSSDLACFSLYATKNVTSGEGGVITTDDDDAALWLRTFANQGARVRYDYEMIGSNRRMTDLQAAIALPQLDDLKGLIEARRRNAQHLSDGLADLPGLVLPRDDPGHVYHQFTIRVTSDAPVSRDALVANLQSAGIGASVYYPRVVFDYACYLNHPSVETQPVPFARQVAAEVLSLPVHPLLTPRELDFIVDRTREEFRA